MVWEGVPGRANPPACWSRAVRRVWVFRLHSEALRLIGIPVKLQGPDLQLVHDLGLGGDLSEGAASLCPFAKVVRVGHSVTRRRPQGVAAALAARTLIR